MPYVVVHLDPHKEGLESIWMCSRVTQSSSDDWEMELLLFGTGYGGRHFLSGVQCSIPFSPCYRPAELQHPIPIPARCRCTTWRTKALNSLQPTTPCTAWVLPTTSSWCGMMTSSTSPTLNLVPRGCPREDRESGRVVLDRFCGEVYGRRSVGLWESSAVVQKVNLFFWWEQECFGWEIYVRIYL